MQSTGLYVKVFIVAVMVIIVEMSCNAITSVVPKRKQWSMAACPVEWPPGTPGLPVSGYIFTEPLLSLLIMIAVATGV